MKKLPNNEKVAQNGKFTQSIRRSPPKGPKCKFVQNKKNLRPQKDSLFQGFEKKVLKQRDWLSIFDSRTFRLKLPYPEKLFNFN